MTDGVGGAWAEVSTEQLLDLVLLQGNRFIKELLRSKGLPIGTNKEQFEQHLAEAFADGSLTREDLREWLAEVEGWGNQHAFVFVVSDADAEGFGDRQRLAQRLDALGLRDLLDAEIPLSPDEELTLATIRHSEQGLSFLWVRGSPALLRRTDLDYEREIDGDDIEFHAFERRWSRVAARFEWDFASNLASVLLARRKDERDYTQQRDELLEVVDAVIPSRSNWQPLDVSRVITQLDAYGLQDPDTQDHRRGVRMNYTVFQGASASVRLAAGSDTAGYQQDAAVRQVRMAVDPEHLFGGSGDCYLAPGADREDAGEGGDGADGATQRELHIRLYGREDRILLWGRMSLAEVWGLLTNLRAYGAA
jgi:hypothetical protein